MRSLPHADAVLEDENPVCIFNAADTLGHYNNIIKSQLCHRRTQARFRSVIQRARAVVQYQNFRISDERPRNAEPLLLSPGKIRPCAFYHGVIPLRQTLYKFLRLRRACGRRYFFAGSILSAL